MRTTRILCCVSPESLLKLGGEGSHLFNINFSLDPLPKTAFLWLAPTGLPGTRLHAKCPARLTSIPGHRGHTWGAVTGERGLLVVTNALLSPRLAKGSAAMEKRLRAMDGTV